MYQWMKSVLLLLLPLLAACNLSTSAPQDNNQTQDNVPTGEWAAYLQNPQRGELLRVTADGTITSYSLGLPQDAYVSSFDMSFNADGSRVAFCQLTYQPESPIATAILYVRDIAAQTNLLTLDLGASDGKTCSLGRRAYSSSQVVVGMMNYTPFSANPDTSQPMWQINIFDVTTGETVSEINASANPIEVDDAFGGAPTLPLIQLFDGSKVIFSFVPFGGDGVFSAPSFEWDIASGTVQPIPHWGKMGMDVLDTGELVYPDNDPNLPVGTPMGPMGSFNVLRLVEGSQTRTIYHTADWLIGEARFINHGRQLALWLLPSFNPDAPESNAVGTRWIALDRAGGVTELLTTPYYANLMPAPNGYAALTQNYTEGDFQRANFTLTLTSDGITSTLWQSGETGDATWELAWVTPTTVATDLAAFPTFTP
jgi:hypothetical protein